MLVRDTPPTWSFLLSEHNLAFLRLLGGGHLFRLFYSGRLVPFLTAPHFKLVPAGHAIWSPLHSKNITKPFRCFWNGNCLRHGGRRTASPGSPPGGRAARRPPRGTRGPRRRRLRPRWDGPWWTSESQSLHCCQGDIDGVYVRTIIAAHRYT